MVYCTCSLLPDEGECQIEEVLGRRKDVELVPLTQDWIEDDWHAPEGGLRLRPDFWAEKGGMDGFYIAVLRKL